MYTNTSTFKLFHSLTSYTNNVQVRSGLQSVNSEVKTLKGSFKDLSNKVGIEKMDFCKQ